MKPKFLYHGSPNKLEGEFLIPHKTKDLSPIESGFSQPLVYAARCKSEAISRALISCRGVSGVLALGRKRPAVIYDGWPEQEIIYLHILSSEFFKKINRCEYVSSAQVKPIKTEELMVEDFTYLIRKATFKEIEKYKRRTS